jgi:hypothetical protein
MSKHDKHSPVVALSDDLDEWCVSHSTTFGRTCPQHEEKPTMLARTRWVVVGLMLAGLALTPYAQGADTPSKSKPAHAELVQGTNLRRLTLSARAAERLGITTVSVSERQVTRARLPGIETPRKVVPYAAVVYDAHGATWVYTSPASLTFIRHPIKVDYIEGDLAVLVDGPPDGTVVVTAGVAELFGTEFEVGH